MKKHISILVIVALFTVIPTVVSDNSAIAKSNTGRILNRIFDNNRGNYNRYDNNSRYNNYSDRNYRRYDKDNRYQNRRRNNRNDRYNNKYNR